MRLSEVKAGDTCVIKSVYEHNSFCRRLCDLGFVAGTRVTVLAPAPFGDPIELFLRGYRITLRKSEARLVEVEQGERKGLWKR